MIKTGRPVEITSGQMDVIKNSDFGLFSDGIVLYKSGDFYRAIGEDAKTMANELGLVLTGKGEMQGKVASFGYHAFDKHVEELVDAGHKVYVIDVFAPDSQHGNQGGKCD